MELQLIYINKRDPGAFTPPNELPACCEILRNKLKNVSIAYTTRETFDFREVSKTIFLVFKRFVWEISSKYFSALAIAFIISLCKGTFQPIMILMKINFLPFFLDAFMFISGHGGMSAKHIEVATKWPSTNVFI